MVHVILCLALWLAAGGTRNKGLRLTLACLLLFAFAALRYQYGNDYASYYHWFLHIRRGGSSPYGQEFLFTLLNMVCPHFFVLIAVTSGAFVYGIHRLLTSQLPMEYAWMGLFLFVANPYLFLMNLSALRQCLAMLLFLAAVPLGIRRRFLAYLSVILLAALFHKSALLLAPAYFLMDSRPVNWRKCLLWLAAVLAVFQFADLPPLLGRIAAAFGDANYVHLVQSSLSKSLRATLLSGLYFLYVLANLPHLEGKALVYAKLYFAANVMSILAFRISLFTRFEMYFDIFSIVALPTIFLRNGGFGPIVVEKGKPLPALWSCINHYVLPLLLLSVYCLRYYAFFVNPMWKDFAEYHTIFRAF